MPRRGDDIRESMDALRRIVRALRLAATDVERDLGVTVAQLFVLQQLSDGRPRSINELAAETVTDPSTISGLMRRLIDGGLVHRGTAADDGRRAAVRLTAKGRETLARAPEAPQARLVAALTSLPPSRRRALADGLRELAAQLGPVEPTFFFDEEPPAPRRRR
jgi:DNA-binding MarR family transcriptional regulator